MPNGEGDGGKDGGEKTAASASPLAMARDLAFVAAVYLFFAGFWYQYFWYQAFGIPLHAIDVPFNQLLVFAYYAFALNATPAAFVAVAAVAIVALLPLIDAGSRPSLGAVRRTIIAICVLAVFPLLYYWSKSATYAAINANVEGHVGAIDRFVFKAGSARNYSPRLLDANGAGSLALTIVAEDSDFYYVLKVPPRPKTSECSTFIPHTYVFTVRKSDVLSVEAWIPGRDPRGLRYGIADVSSSCPY